MLVAWDGRKAIVESELGQLIDEKGWERKLIIDPPGFHTSTLTMAATPMVPDQSMC